VPKFYHI